MNLLQCDKHMYRLKTRTHRTRKKHKQDGKQIPQHEQRGKPLLHLLHVVAELFPSLCINPTASLAVRLGEI